MTEAEQRVIRASVLFAAMLDDMDQANAAMVVDSSASVDLGFFPAFNAARIEFMEAVEALPVVEAPDEEESSDGA